jgi:hypothetical protein
VGDSSASSELNVNVSYKGKEARSVRHDYYSAHVCIGHGCLKGNDRVVVVVVVVVDAKISILAQIPDFTTCSAIGRALFPTVI